MPTKTITQEQTNSLPIKNILADSKSVEILEALRYEDLTLRELTEVIGGTRRFVFTKLSNLLNNGAIRETYDRGVVKYSIASSHTAALGHILYGLWVEEISKHRSRQVLAL